MLQLKSIWYKIVDNSGNMLSCILTTQPYKSVVEYAKKEYPNYKNIIVLDSRPKEEKKMAKEAKETKGIEITGVRVFPVGKGNLLANVQIEIDDELVVKGIKVVDGKNGKFVSMPNEKGKDDKYYDTVFPITKEAREYITDEVLKAYEEETNKSEKTSSRRR